MKWITLLLSVLLLMLHTQIWLHSAAQNKTGRENQSTTADGRGRWLPNGGLHKQYREIQQTAARVEMQNQYLRQRNALLRAEVDDLKNGFDTVAETARRDLGYIERGETLYRFSRN